jgi:uncharacterized membrane protein
MTLETSKNLGGIGAILMFIGVLPLFAYSGIISLVGLILVLIAVKGLADYYKEAGIFNNALYGVVTAIVGGIVFVSIAVVAAVGLLTEIGLNLQNLTDATALSQIDWTAIGLDVVWNSIAIIILDFVVLFVFVIITAIFLRKSLGLLSTKTGVGMFGTTGLIVLIGAILTIIAVGLLLLWIAMLLLAVAFFSIRPQQAQPAMPAGTPT